MQHSWQATITNTFKNDKISSLFLMDDSDRPQHTVMAIGTPGRPIRWPPDQRISHDR